MGIAPTAISCHSPNIQDLKYLEIYQQLFFVTNLTLSMMMMHCEISKYSIFGITFPFIFLFFVIGSKIMVMHLEHPKYSTPERYSIFSFVGNKLNHNMKIHCEFSKS